MTFLAPLVCGVLTQTAPLPEGTGQVAVRAGGRELTVFTYKPAKYDGGPLVLVFHGTNRNAEEYRDWAKVIGDRAGAVVAAPLFDKERFPVPKYQLGGLMADGKALPETEWTVSLVPEIADELRRRAGRADAPYYLIGHSAGGQFLARLAGFRKTDAARVVAANPGSHLFPTEDMPFPYGFGELPASLGGEAAAKRYLAQPLTLYLGTGDTVRDENLPKGPHAEKQGDTRYARGQNAFRAAEKLAKEKGWPFGWRKVEAEGVGHVAADMFKHDRCLDALGLRAK